MRLGVSKCFILIWLGFARMNALSRFLWLWILLEVWVVSMCLRSYRDLRVGGCGNQLVRDRLKLM